MSRIATLCAPAWLAALILLAAGCGGVPANWDAAGNAPLPPCPSSPNCVASEAVDPAHFLPPLPYAGDRETSRHLLLEILQGLPRTRVVAQTGTTLQAECRSRMFGFVDDVWFRFDDAHRQIQFRSAARTGYSDFGVNRERLIAITQAYLAKRSPP